MELNGSVNRSIIPIMYSNDSSFLPTESAHVQLNSDLSTMRLTDTKANGIEKVSDDDVYVDDFESDIDGDANGEQ